MPLVLERRYHVPRSQVWENSAGRQQGKVHLHLSMNSGPWGVPIKVVPRIARTPGSSLCGRRGWYERAPDTDHERSDEMLCPRCKEINDRREKAA